MHPRRFFRSPATAALLGLLLLVAQNLVLFMRHYFKGHTFPDDFLLTYHAIPYYWIEALKLGKDIAWIPVQAMGYPLYMNLQSGYAYLPLRMFAWFDGTYSLHAAVILQGAHVFVGAAGAVLCSRLVGTRWTAALLAGVLYQCFGGFYSNSQHPDIVRSFAFLPWLAAPVLADWRNPGKMLAVSTALLPAWTYAQWTGGYPGAAIASTLLLGCVTVIRMAADREHLRLGFHVLAAQAIGVLLAGVGVVPALLDSRLIDRAHEVGQMEYDYLQLRDVLALTFPVDGSFFAHDPSMRSMFIAIPGLALVLAARLKQVPGARWHVLCGFIALLVALGPLHRVLVTLLPPAGLSRFVMADYRGFIALALILLAAQSFTRMSAAAREVRIWPLLLAAGIVAGVQVMGLAGQRSQDSAAQVLLLLVALACCFPGFQLQFGRWAVPLQVLASLVAVLLYQAYVRKLSAVAASQVNGVLLAALALLGLATTQRFRTWLNPVAVLGSALAVLLVLYLRHAPRSGETSQIFLLAGTAISTLLILAAIGRRTSAVSVVVLLAAVTLLDWARVTWNQRYFAPPHADGVPWVESIVGPFAQTKPRLVERLTANACRGTRRDPPKESGAAAWAGYYTGEAHLKDHGLKLTRHKKILAEPVLAEFARAPWQMIELPAGGPHGPVDLRGAQPSADVACVESDTAAARYRLNLAAPKALLENEVFWEGWSARLICIAGCPSGAVLRIRPEEVHGFRAWRLPAGEWEMRTRFDPTRRWFGWATTSVGVLAWIVFLSLQWRGRRATAAHTRPGTAARRLQPDRSTA